MKFQSNDFVILAVAAVGAVGFYLELEVWDRHGWSRNSLGLVMLAFYGLVFGAWRSWRWWKDQGKTETK